MSAGSSVEGGAFGGSAAAEGTAASPRPHEAVAGRAGVSEVKAGNERLGGGIRGDIDGDGGGGAGGNGGGDGSGAGGGALGPAEFATLFERSFRVLWCIAVGVLRDRSLAEDVVQDAAIIALGKLDQFQAGTNFTAWMGQTVRYAALNHARKRQRRQATSVDPSILESDLSTTSTGRGGSEIGGGHSGAAGSDAEPGAALYLSSRGDLPRDQGHFDDRVVHALESVSDTARACLLLRTVEGLEYREIAKALDIPEGTAMSHVHRTRAFLRERLAPHMGGAAAADPVHRVESARREAAAGERGQERPARRGPDHGSGST